MRTLIASLFAVAAVAAHAEDLPTVKLDMKDGVLTPARIEVPAGKKFKIELSNTGKSPAEFESRPLRKEKVVGPGAQSFVVINGLSAGEYKFVDEFHEKEKSAQGVIVAK